MRRPGEAAIAALAVAAVLLAWLACFRYVDHRRDQANDQLIDLLHLTALVWQQDAGASQATAGVATAGQPAGLDVTAALSAETEVDSRLRLLVRSGMGTAAQRRLAAPVVAYEADLHRLEGSTGAAALQGRITSEASTAAVQLARAEVPLRAAESRDDVILDVGTAVALALPAVVVALSATRHRQRRRHLPGAGTLPAGVPPPPQSGAPQAHLTGGSVSTPPG